MSTTVRSTRRPEKKNKGAKAPAADPKRVPDRLTHDPEAPDAGDFGREAPETRVDRQTEAPDAGEGRASLIEQEYTHGRSQG